MKRLLVVLAAVSLCMGASKCTINIPTPRPTSKPPTVPPTAPPTTTAPPAPAKTACDPAKGLVTECYHWPPEGERYNCKDGTTVKAPAECKAGPACVIPDGIEGVSVHKVSPQPGPDPAIADALRKAIRIRRTCPEGDSPRCLVGVSLDAWRQEIVAELGRMGVCAGLQGGADEVCVLQVAGRCQGWRVGTCGADPQAGCSASGGVVVAWPTAGAVRDTWVSGGTPVAKPTPKPLGDVPPLTKVLIKNASDNPNRPVADATPKACGAGPWCAAHSTGGDCCPGGAEQDPGSRQAVEKLWGPWTWSIDGKVCAATDRPAADGDCCEKDGGNDLRVFLPLGSLPPGCGNLHGRSIRLTGGNGVFGELAIP